MGERCSGGSNGLGLDSGRSYVGVSSGEIEFVLVGRVAWMGVRGNGRDIKRGGGETLEPCDAHGCLVRQEGRERVSERASEQVSERGMCM